MVSFYWIFANAFQIWSTLDGYEKLVEEYNLRQSVTDSNRHQQPFLEYGMVKKAFKRLYFFIGNKSTIMSRRPNCLGFTQTV